MHEQRNTFAATSQPAPHRRAPGTITNKSRITNGRWILPDTDNRSPQARRFRDICQLYADEAGGNLTEAEKAQVRQASLLTLRCEALQAAQVRGEPVDGDEAIRLSSEIRRILAPIVAKGAARKAPEAPDLQAYLASKAAGQAA